MHNCVQVIFLHFSKLVFFPKRIMQNYSFNFLNIFALLLLFLLKSNFTKEKGMYEQVWTYFIYDTCLWIFCKYIYTYLYILMHEKFFTRMILQMLLCILYVKVICIKYLYAYKINV